MSGDGIQGQPREDRKGERSPEGQCLVLKSEMNAPLPGGWWVHGPGVTLASESHILEK